MRMLMNSVTILRATGALEGQGWTEQAISDVQTLPAHTARRQKLLAHMRPAILDIMAAVNMPNEDQKRTIAAASATSIHRSVRNTNRKTVKTSTGMRSGARSASAAFRSRRPYSTIPWRKPTA